MSADQTNFKAAIANTKGAYERQVAVWEEARSRNLYEKACLDRFLNQLPEHADLLDLGCGTGEPIAAYFLSKGHRVTGVDFSAPMIAVAGERFPGARWLVQDARNLRFDETFDGILSWDAFFHLTQDEQRTALPKLAQHVRTGGAIMMTVGPDAGEVTGYIGEETIYHASLSGDEYCSLLETAGFRDVVLHRNDSECGGRSVLFGANKR